MKTFEVILSFKGTTIPIEISTNTTAQQLLQKAADEFNQENIKLLWKGKKLQGDQVVFTYQPQKTPKIMVLATQSSNIERLNQLKQDPTIRGFDQEKKVPQKASANYWGNSGQDKNYKFCRFEACSWQSFGHRPHESTPHDYQASALLEQLATDPGIMSIMRERELVVGTLGEMDPIDDRLMARKQQEGACLLGYNTNHGSRIDIKLRTDDLKGFRSYFDLASTLLHELSHNWVGEHNLLFWGNFGQMRVEYLYQHYKNASLFVVNGKTTAQLAGLPRFSSTRQIYDFVMQELQQEMTQHRLHPQAIAGTIQSRLDELEAKQGSVDEAVSAARPTDKSARELALEAAERRKSEQNKKE